MEAEKEREGEGGRVRDIQRQRQTKREGSEKKGYWGLGKVYLFRNSSWGR